MLRAGTASRGAVAAVALALSGCGGTQPLRILQPITVLDTQRIAQAVPPGPGAPAISIIIDDLGDRRSAGRQVLALPGPIACAFLPRAPHSRGQARQAHAAGKEVLLHLPMEAQGGIAAAAARLALTRSSGARDVESRLAQSLIEIPHARGVNNHQGSLLTRSERHMGWLMDALRQRGGLYFIDSRTSPRSAAYRIARERGLPAAARDVFLDDNPEQGAVEAEWRKLLQIARRHGTALAIGHPHPVTLQLLEREIPRLAAQGIRLVPPSELIRLRQGDPPIQPRLQWAARLHRLR